MKRGKVNIFETVNRSTGETVEGVPIYVAPKIRWGEDWIMLFQRAYGELALDKEMTGEIWRVWALMISRLAFENYIVLPQSEIAKTMGLKKQAVHRAIKVLLAKRLILEGPRAGNCASYRLNSAIGWKGKVVNIQNRRMEELDEPRKPTS